MTMAITLENGALSVTGEDHADLYALYCEDEVGETFGPFTLVVSQPEGEWDWGVQYLLVVTVEGYEGLWGATVEDQTGDERVSLLDPRNCPTGASLSPVEAVPSVTYSFTKS